jgi:hypothetical protein
MKGNPFTKLWVALAILVVRTAPLWSFAMLSRSGTASAVEWGVVLAVTLLWQGAFHVVAKRCSTPDFGYTRGLFLIGMTMSTSWIYLDLVFVGVAVVAAQLVAIAIALMPDASVRYSGLVHLFYRNRMRQSASTPTERP